MDKTIKTVLIIGGIAAAAGVGYVLYKKYSTAAAVKQTAAAANANPLSSSGVQGYITGASAALTALGNVFGAHTGTNVATSTGTGGGSAGVSNLLHVGTNTTTTGKVDLSGGSDASTGGYQGESNGNTDDGSSGDNSTDYGN